MRYLTLLTPLFYPLIVGDLLNKAKKKANKKQIKRNAINFVRKSNNKFSYK